MIFRIFIQFIHLLKQIVSSIFQHQQKSTLIITSATEAHSILKSSNYNRQIPNAWLMHTFSIVNPFTMEGASIRNDFKNKVIQRLAHWKDETNYRTLLNLLDEHIRRFGEKNSKQFYLSKFVKRVALDAFLSGILQCEVTEEFLEELPDLIIHLWKHRTDQKAQKRLKQLLTENEKNFSQSDFWMDIQHVLASHQSLIAQSMINDFDEKISNPLNIIIPGWETMWRVVFYSLLELLRRADLLTEIRQDLANHRCSSLRSIIKETLRLYPPTKNIYRKNLLTNEIVCISVQTIHRDVKVWGDDALTFRPSRFNNGLTSEQTQCYLPFSISCPARHGFAYDFAGGILSTILMCFPHLDLVESLPADKPLDITRNAYRDLLVFQSDVYLA